MTDATFKYMTDAAYEEWKNVMNGHPSEPKFTNPVLWGGEPPEEKSKAENTAQEPGSRAPTTKREKQVAVSPMNKKPKNKSILLIEKDERPGIGKNAKARAGNRSLVMAKTQPTSEGAKTIRIDEMKKPMSLTLAKNQELMEAVDLQKKLEKKMEERRREEKTQEITARNKTVEGTDMVEIINRHYRALQSGVRKIKYTRTEYESVIAEVQTIFTAEKTLIDLDPPCVVVGDLHGQFNDLINMFVLLGRPPETVYVFTGDYVDRGQMSLEVIMLLFAYKICYRITFTCCVAIMKFHVSTRKVIWALFQRCFNNMPISALIATKIMCMHGGLSPSLTTLDDLRNYKKPIRNPSCGIINDMLWADPDISVFEWKTSSRGSGFVFGTNVIDDTCARLGIELIIRAHQLCVDGYWVVSGNKLITIFSAPVYGNQNKNAASVVKIDEKLTVQLVLFVPESPTIKETLQQKNRVWDPAIEAVG
ncbi:unnamed protein product [Caenorhabditis sp. 36 PRJEB53466]|nr:unnamed protein product [Caenorhabditis sp. 36 PRJEB53466]